MVREGWIEQGKSKDDKRFVNVQLTQKGKEIAETLGCCSKEYVQRTLKHIPQEKIPQIVESLKLIVESVGKEV
jgi:DNA-binding MarR family transcriptional regulator